MEATQGHPPWSPVEHGAKTKSARRPQGRVYLVGVGNPGRQLTSLSGQVPDRGK